MSSKHLPGASLDYTSLPIDPADRHEALVDFFGQVLMRLRNWSLEASRTLVESNEAREKLATIRRGCFDGVARLSPEQRKEAMLLAEDTLDGFIERFLWLLGNEGTDDRIGPSHAYRLRIEMEVIDVNADEVVEEEAINRGGSKFFGSYWGRWLNRFGDK